MFELKNQLLLDPLKATADIKAVCLEQNDFFINEPLFSIQTSKDNKYGPFLLQSHSIQHLDNY